MRFTRSAEKFLSPWNRQRNKHFPSAKKRKEDFFFFFSTRVMDFTACFKSLLVLLSFFLKKKTGKGSRNVDLTLGVTYDNLT